MLYATIIRIEAATSSFLAVLRCGDYIFHSHYTPDFSQEVWRFAPPGRPPEKEEYREFDEVPQVIRDAVAERHRSLCRPLFAAIRKTQPDLWEGSKNPQYWMDELPPTPEANK